MNTKILLNIDWFGPTDNFIIGRSRKQLIVHFFSSISGFWSFPGSIEISIIYIWNSCYLISADSSLLFSNLYVQLLFYIPVFWVRVLKPLYSLSMGYHFIMSYWLTEKIELPQIYFIKFIETLPFLSVFMIGRNIFPIIWGFHILTYQVFF